MEDNKMYKILNKANNIKNKDYIFFFKTEI